MVIIFLKPTGEIRPELVSKIIKEIFQVYASSIVELCNNFQIEITTFKDVLNEEYDNKRNLEKK